MIRIRVHMIRTLWRVMRTQSPPP